MDQPNVGLDILYTLNCGNLITGMNFHTIVQQAMKDVTVSNEIQFDDIQFNEIQFPIITAAKHTSLKTLCHVIRYGGDVVRYNIALEIMMPCSEASLIWMPWLPHQVQPPEMPGNYHHLSFGKQVVMPRRTKCYGYAYAFSGQVHPVEAVTPPSIEALYDETVSIFRLEQGPNMCLENNYNNGREYISEHSDDEKQFGELHDVYCWVTGPALRTAVFRVKNYRKAVPKTLSQYCCDPANPDETRELFSIRLPAGFYTMRGRKFQERYSHEFPQHEEGLLKRLLEAAPKLWNDFPIDVPMTDKGANQTTLVQSAWLKVNRDRVEQACLQGKLKKKRGGTPNDDVVAFKDWCLERTSYTLRQFGQSGVTKKEKKEYK